MTDRPILFSAPMVRALIEGRKTKTRRIIKPQPPATVTSAGVISRSSEGQTDEWSWLSGDPRDIDTWGFEGDFKTRFVPGDRLWVKETWACHWANDNLKPSEIIDDLWSVRYFANDYVRPAARDGSAATLDQFKKKRVAIFMPRWASRLTLTVTDVRVERLQACSEADALAEGVCRQYPTAEDHEWLRAHHEENYGSPPSQADIDQFDEGVFVVPGTDCGFGPKPRQPIWGPTATSCYASLWNSINGAGAWEANPWVVAITFTVEQGNIDHG
ncbi:hypothetical protein [Sphingopyxis flava]|uniref:Uncharacterized protein n=1 Tax=Sphingopyxis flava TaxID=1507287 RepID=A0A1T5ACZ8_9SPHN|nr:hypothetical protein [Sphingopyxis flava]SKB32854.1 hypothetical protein SAMN06295937_1003118 [Sphingopyxis flava]